MFRAIFPQQRGSHRQELAKAGPSFQTACRRCLSLPEDADARKRQALEKERSDAEERLWSPIRGIIIDRIRRRTNAFWKNDSWVGDEAQDAQDIQSSVQHDLAVQFQTWRSQPDTIPAFHSKEGQASPLEVYILNATDRANGSHFNKKHRPVRTLCHGTLLKLFKDGKSGFSRWSYQGEQVCGFTAWQGRPPFTDEKVRERLRQQPREVLWEGVRRRDSRRNPDEREHILDHLKYAEVVDGLLNGIAQPIPLEDLIIAFMACRKWQDAPAISLEGTADGGEGDGDGASLQFPDKRDFTRIEEARAYLRDTWQQIMELIPTHRNALLLGGGKIDIKVFVASRITDDQGLNQAIVLERSDLKEPDDGQLTQERSALRQQFEASMLDPWLDQEITLLVKEEWVRMPEQQRRTLEQAPKEEQNAHRQVIHSRIAAWYAPRRKAEFFEDLERLGPFAPPDSGRLMNTVPVKDYAIAYRIGGKHTSVRGMRESALERLGRWAESRDKREETLLFSGSPRK